MRRSSGVCLLVARRRFTTLFHDHFDGITHEIAHVRLVEKRDEQKRGTEQEQLPQRQAHRVRHELHRALIESQPADGERSTHRRSSPNWRAAHVGRAVRLANNGRRFHLASRRSRLSRTELLGRSGALRELRRASRAPGQGERAGLVSDW